MIPFNAVCQTFLGLVIAASAYRLGHLFVRHQWDAAAGWGGLLLAAIGYLILLWALSPRPVPGRHCPKGTNETP